MNCFFGWFKALRVIWSVTSAGGLLLHGCLGICVERLLHKLLGGPIPEPYNWRAGMSNDLLGVQPINSHVVCGRQVGECSLRPSHRWVLF